MVCRLESVSLATALIASPLPIQLRAATMGGYLNRKNDGPLGAEIAWNGHAALSFTAWMLGHSIDAGETSEVRKHIS